MTTTIRDATPRQVSPNHLLGGAFYLIITTGALGGLGFAFWLVNARLFGASQVGEATSLLSATALISYFSLFGLNSTLIRYLPRSGHRDEEVTIGLLLVFGVAVLLSLAYVAATPVIAPSLRPVVGSFWRTLSFAFLSAFAAVNLCTDSVFIGLRAASYNFFIDGLLQSVVKLALPVAFVGLGAYGIVLASGLASTVAVVASIVMLGARLGLRPSVRDVRGVTRRLVRFSAANYLASLLNLVPILVLPTLVLDHRGAAQAGYYYIIFQIANLLNGGAYAISESLFAEGSYGEAALRELGRRSAVVIGGLMIPASILLAAVAHWLLRIFGPEYSRNAASALAVLALGGIGVSLNSWTGSLLRITDRLWSLVLSNVLYAGTIIGLAAAWVHAGLVWVAWAWVIGNVASGTVGALLLLPRRRPLRGNQGNRGHVDVTV